ncbi:hypothetical protein ACEPAF_719 [Sanghuangporus sanghuang]
MPFLDDLPNETLSAVCAHLNPSSLCALVCASHRLQSVGERLLYSDIVITDSVDSDPDTIVTPRRLLNCYTAIVRRPYLAQCIRRFVVRWTRDRARKHHECLLAPDVLPALKFLLQSASQTEVLELHLAGLPPGFDYNALLLGACFRLRRLALSGSSDAPVESFLCTQPSIVYLHLPDHRNPLALRPQDIPFLETFRGDLHCAGSIIPGRPVSTLILSGHEPSDLLLAPLGHSTRPIRRLDLSALSVTPTQLLTISKHLTALETLRMRLALRHTLHFTFSGMMLLSALTQVLGAFQHLVHLDLSPTSVDGVIGVRNEVEEHSLCSAWSAVAPSLRRVKFPSGTNWSRSPDGIWRAVSISPSP